ncbi:hypothetical protein BpHYR1_038674 [Brachionus plicatilis]|uniref:Uncharacterized protein n=1 Tax=Brachionus plicatilis TaxID=10195 RepID=A0A3M7Q5M5_BRAPC|nr:hypothetical protein BpHYR1_038674 [Brachionus plicatilis]
MELESAFDSAIEGLSYKLSKYIHIRLARNNGVIKLQAIKKLNIPDYTGKGGLMVFSPDFSIFEIKLIIDWLIFYSVVPKSVLVSFIRKIIRFIKENLRKK